MSIVPQLAASQGRADEQPNIALAEKIVAERDLSALRELSGLLIGKNKGLRSDALKTLYEVGYRAPDLIAPYITQFKNLLANPDNRMVWGAMCAIDGIAGVTPEAVYMILPQIMAAVDKGSVITRDHAVQALVKLAAHARFAKTTFPLLIEQLRTAPTNQLPRYAELVATVTSPGDAGKVSSLLSERLAQIDLPAKRKRVEKVLAKLAKG